VVVDPGHQLAGRPIRLDLPLVSYDGVVDRAPGLELRTVLGDY
jgi:hypothetical protein